MTGKLDLRSRRAMLALGTLGLGGVGATAASLPAQAAPVGLRSAGEGRGSVEGVVISDSVGAAAAALTPNRPLSTRPVVSATESRRNLLVGGSLSVSGAVRPVSAGGRTVALEERRGGGWLTVARSGTHRLGRYRLGFRPAAAGTIKLRVLVRGGVSGIHARRTLGSVNVFRKAFASWYGGGGSLACGGTLTSSTLGVASKTLPCGTMLRVRFGSRTVRVPVVDRGPYVAGRDFDLTPATKRALGFGDLGVIWVT